MKDFNLFRLHNFQINSHTQNNLCIGTIWILTDEYAGDFLCQKKMEEEKC